MANNAASVARTLGKEDGLYLGLEKLVIQRRRCGGGRSWLAPSLLQRPGRRQDQTPRDDHIRRGTLHSVHRNLPQKISLGNGYCLLERKRLSRRQLRGCNYLIGCDNPRREKALALHFTESPPPTKRAAGRGRGSGR